MKYYIIEYKSGKEEILPVNTEKDKDFLIFLITLYAGEIESLRPVPKASLPKDKNND